MDCLPPAEQAVCTEAGLLALRERRMCVTMVDFVKVSLFFTARCIGIFD